MSSSGEPIVEVHRTLAALRPWRAALDALNLASRRPSPFQTLAYLETFLAHDEYAVPGSEPLLLLALDEGAPVGFLPLRRRPERLLGVSLSRVEHLVTHDCDRPGLVARPEDEPRCASAFYRHLLERERAWTFLELAEQDATSPLLPRPGLVDPRRFHVRAYLNNPNATVRLEGLTFERWFRGLGNFRSTLARRARALLAAGEVRFLACADPGATPALLDLYLELELRSWKHAARAGISRHPARIDLFRALLAPAAPAAPVFHWLFLDELPVAGMLSLSFAGTFYQLELAYDAAHGELAPGNLLFLLSLRDALARGARAYNLLGNFAYHKSRWRAEITPTEAVQIYARGGLHHARAALGTWRRRLLGPPRTQLDAEHNLTKPSGAEPQAAGDPAARARALAALARAAAAGARLDQLDGAALAAAFPFEVGRRSA